MTTPTADRRRGADAGRPPRVGFFGLLGSGNLGNDASLQVLIDYVRGRFPDAEIDALCDGPDSVTARFGFPAERLHWNRHEYETADRVGLIARKGLGKVADAGRIAAWVRRHDVVIMPGMGAFEATFPLRPWGMPYSLFLLCAAGRRLGTRVAVVSAGANDVEAPAVRRLFVGAARRANYLSFRDTYSQDAMRRAGLAGRGDRVYPDVVFAMPTPEVPDGLTATVAVGVLDYHGGNDDRARAAELNQSYRTKLKRLVHLLLDQGRNVRLFEGATVDRVIVDEVLADVAATRVEDAHRVTVAQTPTLEDLLVQMADVDAVVATRFHNVVCALKLSKPTVSVGYARKNDELMAAFGLGAFCQRAADLDVDRLMSQLAELEDGRDGLAEPMTARNAEYRALLDDQFARLDRELFADFLPDASTGRSTGPDQEG